jgi:enoyl-CoA hydratase/carnithine racemase
MNAELHDAWQTFRDDDEAFVLVITGTGDAFCAGWDLQDAADLGEAGLEGMSEKGQGWDGFRNHVYTSRIRRAIAATPAASTSSSR